MANRIVEASLVEVATLRGWVPGMPREATRALFTDEEWAFWTRALSAPREPQTFAIHSARDWDNDIARDERENPPRD